MVTFFRMILRGHLTEPSLEAALEQLARDTAAAASQRPPSADRARAWLRILVDCSTMTSYDPEARSRFVRWGRESVQRLERVGIVTDKTLWHMIIRAMALASGVQMRPFVDPADAEAWLRTP